MDSSAHSNARPSKALIALTTALMISHSALAADGPFGISQGIDIATLPGCHEAPSKPTWYVCKTVPTPHPDLEHYIVQATRNTGVCWIRGASGAIQSDAFGRAIRASVEDFKEQISSAYAGKVSKRDLVISGSMWAKPEYWMMSLYKSERQYGYEWSEKTGAVMKNGVTAISLYAAAAGSGAGMVVVEYFFPNHAECLKAAVSVKAKGL